MKSRAGKLGKAVHAPGKRHHQRRNLNAALRKGRIVFKAGDLLSVQQRDRADGPAPQPDFGQRAHGFSSHCQGLPVACAARLPEARCRTLPLCFNTDVLEERGWAEMAESMRGM